MLGSWWDHVWVMLGVILVSRWGHVGVMLGSFGGHVGIVSGSCWDHLGVMLGSFWDHVGIILGSCCGHFEIIFRDQRFLDFSYPYSTKPYILRSGGYPNCIIFGDFFEDALREASGTRFFVILNAFGLPLGSNLAPKRHQKMRPKK